MHRTLCTAVLLVGSTATAQAFGQTVNNQSVNGIVFATDSSGESIDEFTMPSDPTLAPASYSLFVENDEPLSLPDPTYHTASFDANLDSTGSIWIGSGRTTAHYAEALDLTQDYGGSTIPAATAFFLHSIDFSIDNPTTVNVNANFLVEMTDPFNPTPVGNTFSLLFRDLGDKTIYDTQFDSSMLGVSQQRNDTFILAPGDYNFRLAILINTQEQLGFRDGSIDFSYDVSFVPAPATATLLVGGLAIGARRRR